MEPSHCLQPAASANKPQADELLSPAEAQRQSASHDPFCMGDTTGGRRALTKRDALTAKTQMASKV